FFVFDVCRSRVFFFFSSRRRHTRSKRDWSSDVCSSDLPCADCCLGTRRCNTPPYRQRHHPRHFPARNLLLRALAVFASSHPSPPWSCLPQVGTRYSTSVDLGKYWLQQQERHSSVPSARRP